MTKAIKKEESTITGFSIDEKDLSILKVATAQCAYNC